MIRSKTPILKFLPIFILKPIKQKIDSNRNSHVKNLNKC